MELEVRRLQVTDWSAYGTEQPLGHVGVARDIWVTTEIGKREQRLDLGFQRFPDGRIVAVFTVVTQYSLVADRAEGFLIFGLSHGDKKLAGIPMKLQKTDFGHVLITDNFDAIKQVLTCLLMGVDLWVKIIAPSGTCTEFPLPADAKFKDTFAPVAAAQREHQTNHNPATKQAYWNMVKENNERLFAQADNDLRNRRLLVIGATIAVLALIGIMFGP